MTEDKRPPLFVGKDIERVVPALLAALAEHDAVFDHGGKIVTVAGAGKDATISPLDGQYMAELVAQRRRFVRASRDGGEEPASPPFRVLDGLQQRPSREPIRRLRGIARVPYIGEGGHVVTAPGFDERTGFLGAWEKALPPLRKNLTKADARRAYEDLSALWENFPFETETDGAAMLAPLITAIVRPWLVAENVAAPWFLITANRPGVGKSLAATLAGDVLGDDALALTAADCPRGELAKRIDGYLLGARPLVVLDDVKQAFGSGAIDALATAGGSFDVRRLGSTGQIRCVNGTTWIVTGNNMALASDSGRRFVPIHLRSATPNPADLPDAPAEARKHRERYLTAVLTIVAAWQQNGSPAPPKGDKFVTYERWRAIVAGALYFASGFDVCGRRGELESRDEKQQAMGPLLSDWEDAV